jgi:glycosyltransferase involved in cell wall biosynthesis
MRILILNQAYWPDVVATAQHMTDWAEHLVSRGHDVTVIASRSVYGKQGAVLSKAETHNGVKIIRVGSNRFGKRGLVSRALDFAKFHVLAGWKALAGKRPDIIVCLTTPPFIGVVGYLTRALRRSRYVQYEMDIYPDVAVALGALKKNSLAHRFFERVHRRLLNAAARIVVLGRDMDALIASKGIAEKKRVLVTPWADPDEIVPVPRGQNAFRKEHGLEDKFVITYSGNLGLGHDITTICSAMEQLGTDPAVRFVFIGGGKRMEEIKKFAAGKNFVPPLILEYQPREKLPETLSAADAHLITQAPGTTGLIVPSKLYGILAAGRPILYIGPADTEVALTVKEHSLGHIIQIGDTPAFLAAVRQLQSTDSAALESKARDVLRKNYSRQVNCEKLTAMVESLAKK